MLIKEIIERLYEIHAHKGYVDVNVIKIIQDKIWLDETIKDNKLSEILSVLAYDLDFYEPNAFYRKGEPSLYGEEKLLKVVESGLSQIKEHLLNIDR